ncbi:MAG: penicillin-binding protein 2 [Anaerolineae bacterium]|mgnify:CR=1 FL=1|nr:penicillin-binding protein 2 [Anaerolineae bacterium]
MSKGVERSVVWARLRWLAGVLGVFGLVLVAQLVRWQLVDSADLSEVARRTHNRRETLDARRGTVYSTDGRVLSTDVYTYSLSASPAVIEDAKAPELADRLFPLLGLSRDGLITALSGDAVWQPLADGLSIDVADQIAGWEQPGLYLEARLSRAYPDGSISEPVLGFVSQARDGYYGVEGYYDGVLTGAPGAWLGDMALSGQDAPFGRQVLEPPEDGADLYLTLDSRVQYVLWRELSSALEYYQAPSGTIIAMHPRTAAILGIVTLPTYDPSEYGQADPSLYEDPVVSHEWEPGSVFKVITMAAGLDAGVVTPESTFDDTGIFELAGATIRNWDREAHGTVTMKEILGLSLNTGASFVSTSLGADRFYDYLSAFGFGQLLGVDLQAEARGSMKRPGDGRWYEADLATNAFGQGIAVTPLQMLAAVCAVANDGVLMQPYIVEHRVGRDGVSETEPKAVRQVISPETADALTRMMVDAVRDETEAATVPGYDVAGKTGTSQIPIPGGYHPSDIIASFVGFFPADDPQLCILVKIDRPQAGQWGSEVAAPVFSKVASQVAVLLGIEPSSADGTRVASQ